MLLIKKFTHTLSRTCLVWRVFFFTLILTHLYTHPMEPGASTAWGLECVRTWHVEHRVHADSTGHLSLLGLGARCLLGSVFQAVGTVT